MVCRRLSFFSLGMIRLSSHSHSSSLILTLQSLSRSHLLHTHTHSLSPPALFCFFVSAHFSVDYCFLCVFNLSVCLSLSFSQTTTGTLSHLALDSYFSLCCLVIFSKCVVCGACCLFFLFGSIRFDILINTV